MVFMTTTVSQLKLIPTDSCMICSVEFQPRTEAVNLAAMTGTCIYEVRALLYSAQH